MTADARDSLAHYLTEYNRICRDVFPENAPTVRIALLRSISCEILEKVLTVEAAALGFKTAFHMGGYRQYAQEILDGGGALYEFQPQVVILAVSLEDLIPGQIETYYDDPRTFAQVCSGALKEYLALVGRLCAASGAHVFVCNFAPPRYAPFSSHQAGSLAGIANLASRGNIELATACENTSLVHVLDLDHCIREIGAENAYDPKMWFVAKNPYSFPLYARLGSLAAGMLGVLYGQRKKCLVLDMDNTLWKGIVGEDGIQGIKVTPDFQEFQRQLLHWKKTGVLLALNSKNNSEDALEVLDKHPDMVLRTEDFAAMRINWNDKASNMREIAKELNIGLDSLVFFDDSAVECEWIQRMLPMVTVIRLDGNSLFYPTLARDLDGMDFLTLTGEDAQRTAMYSAQRERQEFQEHFTDLESYLKALSMRLTFCCMNKDNRSRLAQMTQKTNQFNTTTRRYTEPDLEALAKAGARVLGVSVEDKFGDNGLTGCLIIRLDAAARAWHIDNFLLSCRIMGRHVEDALFGHMLDLARNDGVGVIIGEYIPTLKNKPVEKLYERLGFRPLGEGLWEYPTDRDFFIPAYFHITL